MNFQFGKIAKLLTVVVVLNTLFGCGDSKVLKDQKVIPFDTAKGKVFPDVNGKGLGAVQCLRVEDLMMNSGIELSPQERAAFQRALVAHLAPLKYLVNSECKFRIQLSIQEYEIKEFIVASRLIINVGARILTENDEELWTAKYRFTENGGSFPLDPISAGLAVFSSAQNASDDNKLNGIFIAVRRLLLNLPEKTVSAFVPPNGDPKKSAFLETAEVKKEKQSSFVDALRLWDEGARDKAIQIIRSLYNRVSHAALGYQYGLMLEAVGREEEAASAFAEAAIAQAKIQQLGASKRAIGRLQRLNDLRGGLYQDSVNRAIAEVNRISRR